MENETGSVSQLFKKASDYLKLKIELFKLKAVDKVSGAVSIIFAGLIIITFVWLFILMASIGLALWIGELLGEIYCGFFIVAGFYILIIIILLLFRKQILKRPIANRMIKKILN
jgi:hypothetical protein